MYAHETAHANMCKYFYGEPTLTWDGQNSTDIIKSNLIGSYIMGNNEVRTECVFPDTTDDNDRLAFRMVSGEMENRDYQQQVSLSLIIIVIWLFSTLNLAAIYDARGKL